MMSDLKINDKSRKHAFLIAAHNNWDLLVKIIRILDNERNDIYIHINKNVNDFDFEYFRTLPTHSNVYYIERFVIEWGTEQWLLANLTFLKEARGNGNYMYYHNLTGGDMPIKPMSVIHDFFDKNKGKEFLHFTSIPPINRNIYERYSLDHRFEKYVNRNILNHKIELKSLLIKTVSITYLMAQRFLRIDKQKNNPYELCYGASWFSITDELAEYLIENIDWVKKYFTNTFACDECCLQTLVYHSPFKDKLYDNKFDGNYRACQRFIIWKDGTPYIWREQDFDKLIGSELMFARKFNPTVDNNIIEKIFNYVIQ
ncbi:MAG: beta-1,6-N-acetylglucosaminyltransferase [Mobilitalea sp.]